MAQHIFVGSTPPSSAPTGIGHHYIDTTNKKSYVSVGITSVVDWNLDEDAVASVNGYTGAVTLVKGDVGLGNADNTSDVNKPVSTAQGLADTAVQNYSVQRANHTGTQLSSTISDFASTVLATVLAGLSLATGTAITAADTILSALGKLQKQISDNLSTLTGHTSNTSNPHSVTAAQVGNSTAQWNADKIQSRDVAATAPTGGEALIWDAGTSEWKPGNASPAFGSVSGLTPDGGNVDGVALTAARSDHLHNVPAAAAVGQTPDQANAEGVSTSVARADHIHNIPAATVSSIGTANAKGVAASFALSDHVHNHGAQTDQTLHAVATPSANGFLSSTDKTKIDTMVFGFLAYTNNATQSTTQNNTSYTILTLDLNVNSFANSLFTKSSATEFRTDFAGYVEINVKGLMQNTTTNDKPWRATVHKNGSPIVVTEIHSMGKINLNRYASASGSWIVPCAVNDLFSLGYSNAENVTDTIQTLAQETIMTISARYKS